MVAATVTVVLGVGQTSSHAEPASDVRTADQIAAEINRLAPVNAGAKIGVDRRTNSIEASGESLSVSIPLAGNGVVELRRRGDSTTRLAVRLPSMAAARPADIAGDGTVAYRNNLTGVDVAVQTFPDGVRVHTVIQNAEAPVEFNYPVQVPAGASLTSDSSGSVLLVDAKGALIGGIAPAWAVDGQRRPVATRYEVRGTTVVQIVDHRATDVQYPVVADPYLGIDLISSAAWEYYPGDGWTLKVTPTWWARATATNSIAASYGWSELYAKYRDRGLCCNLDGMRDQYICHHVVVGVRDPNKATWNLDEWRPDVSYAETVNTYCNPGGSRWFD